MPRITPISSGRLRKVFEKAGFGCVRIEGDHFIKNNLRSAGLSRQEYFRLLELV